MINTEINYSKVTSEILASFLGDLGWCKTKNYQDGTSVWTSNEYKDVFWLPPHNNFDDFSDVVNRIIQLLSISLNKEESELAEELIQYYNNKDLLQLRVISEDVNQGTIQIDDGTSLYESLQILISSSLKRVSGIKQEFKELFSNETLLGHPSKGSYIVRTYTPVIEIEDKTQQSDLAQIEKKALGRQITQKLISRLNLIISIYKKVNEDNSATNVADKLLENGFTKKECIAIENLFGSKGHRDWELKVLWAKMIDKNKPNTILKFDHSYSSAARRVVNYLDSLQSKISPITIEGRVTGLIRDYDEELGTVKLKAKVHGKECTVTIHLNEGDFDVAHIANVDRATIKVKGELTETKVGKRKYYEIHNIEQIKLLPPPENIELDLGGSSE
jgi:hypothetical protein